MKATKASNVTVGMDLGDKTSRYCMLDENGEVLREASVGTFAESTSERNIILWLNEYFGRIERDGKSFADMGAYRESESIYTYCWCIQHSKGWPEPHSVHTAAIGVLVSS